MSFVRTIALDRPLSTAVIPGRTGRLYTEREVAALTEEAYRRGVDSARAAADQQMVEMRADVGHLSENVLTRLDGVESLLVGQLRDALPGLAVEIARRLLAGYEPSAEVVARLCGEALEQLFPEREGLELTLSPRDAELVAQFQPDWITRYPGLRIRTDAALKPGDCLVRSRFGLTDARQDTKLGVLAHGLTGN